MTINGERIVQTRPEIKPCLRLGTVNLRSRLEKIDLNKKVFVVVTTDPDEWRYYLARVLFNDFEVGRRFKEVTKSQIHNIFNGNDEDIPSLSYLSTGVLLIKDGPGMYQFAQGECMLQQLIDESEYVIYWWNGDMSSFKTKSQLDKSIPVEVIDGKHNTECASVSGTTGSNSGIKVIDSGEELF